MKQFFIWIGIILIGLLDLNAQNGVLDRKEFFEKETTVEITLNTNLKRLYSKRKNTPPQTATITWQNPEGTGDITESLKISRRGKFRNENCGLASLLLDFKDPEKKSSLRKLGRVKMVTPCEAGYDYEQYVIQEYLIYKMFNLITDASFKARLLRVNIQDSLKSKKHFKEYAFVIEPVKSVEKRLGWEEIEDIKFSTEQTNRASSTVVFLFQYMIGNTDWSVPGYHNIKLFRPKDTAQTRPYVIPYDFDFSGIINAPYASPPESTGLTSVTERYYMGYIRRIEELRAAAAPFLSKEKEIFSLIKNCELLKEDTKYVMADYLKEFFEIIKSDERMKSAFIENALNAK